MGKGLCGNCIYPYETRCLAVGVERSSVDRQTCLQHYEPSGVVDKVKPIIKIPASPTWLMGGYSDESSEEK